MGKYLLLFSSVLLLSACGEQYNIAGNSTVPCLDGRMLYLRVSDGERSQKMEATTICLDSCKVVHGRFRFEGDVDTARMAMLFTQDQCVLPLVIENGDLSIQVDNVAQKVSGSPLNDKLYAFFKKRNRLDNEMWELQQKSIQMMRKGKTPAEINRKVGKRLQQLSERTEQLEIQFVKENYNNVLGPGFFYLLCSQYPTPIITKQIETILTGAPAVFLHDPFVEAYLRQAHARPQFPGLGVPLIEVGE